MSQEEIIRELEDARDAITAAYERRRELALKAREAGVPVTRIAKALGLSRERVYKIARNL